MCCGAVALCSDEKQQLPINVKNFFQDISIPFSVKVNNGPFSVKVNNGPFSVKVNNGRGYVVEL